MICYKISEVVTLLPPAPVDADLLAHHSRGASVQLAILNPSQTALAVVTDPFLGIASPSVRTGLSAVVATQMERPDHSILLLVKEFPRDLVDDCPIDAGVAEGRKAIIAGLGEAWRGYTDWDISVLS